MTSNQLPTTSNLPPEHRFPMPKFGRIYETLVCDGIAGLDQFYLPTLADFETLARVHTPQFIRDYLDGSIDVKAMRPVIRPVVRIMPLQSMARAIVSLMTSLWRLGQYKFNLSR